MPIRHAQAMHLHVYTKRPLLQTLAIETRANMQASLSVAVGQRAPNRAGYVDASSQRTTQPSNSGAAAAAAPLRTTRPRSPQRDNAAGRQGAQRESAERQGTPPRPRDAGDGHERRHERDRERERGRERGYDADRDRDHDRGHEREHGHRRDGDRYARDADRRRPFSREREFDRAPARAQDGHRPEHDRPREWDRDRDRFNNGYRRPDPRGGRGGHRDTAFNRTAGGPPASRVFGRSANDVFGKAELAANGVHGGSDDMDEDGDAAASGAVFIGRRKR